MMFNNLIYTANMDPQQRAWFYAEYEQARKDEAIGVLLALFLGCFGLHHFYLRRNGLGVLYVLFCWTGLTAILGFIECFLMPGRVREFNAIQAAHIASHIVNMPAVFGSAPSNCTGCGMPVAANAVFCPHCGHHVASHVTA
jgi:TM2 domain-containing membrane protein YozV